MYYALTKPTKKTIIQNLTQQKNIPQKSIMDVSKLKGKVFNDYKFLSILGRGSFGVVYEAESVKDNKRYAIKVESSRATYSQIYFEYDTYIYLHFCYRQFQQGNPPIPNMHGIYTNKDFTFFVMDLLGPSLHDLFKKNDRKISHIKAIDYGKQMIGLIRKIHKMKFVYRDIKPENFIFTKSRQRELKLVDFGLAKKVSLPSQKCKVRQTSKIIGTLRYASISAHEGKVIGRKDDVQSLVYVIIYLMKGSLPWQGMRAKTQNEKDDLVYKMKKSMSAKELCEGLPQAFQKLVNYVRDEDFFQKDQCYDQLIEYLNESLDEYKHPLGKNQSKEWLELKNQLDQQLQAFNPLGSNLTSPLAIQKKTSSNQATNTEDLKSNKDQVKNLCTPTKKKPIKVPSIKQNFALNDDSDSEVSPQIPTSHRKSNFIDDDLNEQQM